MLSDQVTWLLATVWQDDNLGMFKAILGLKILRNLLLDVLAIKVVLFANDNSDFVVLLSDLAEQVEGIEALPGPV